MLHFFGSYWFVDPWPNVKRLVQETGDMLLVITGSYWPRMGVIRLAPHHGRDKGHRWPPLQMLETKGCEDGDNGQPG